MEVTYEKDTGFIIYEGKSPIFNEYTHELVTLPQTYRLNLLFDSFDLPIWILEYLSEGISVRYANLTDYEKSQSLLPNIINKVVTEVTELVSRKAFSEVVILRDGASPWVSQVIEDTVSHCFETRGIERIKDLVYEGFIRVVAEVMYIERVEKRQLTELEGSNLTELLNVFKSDSVLEGLSLSDISWFNATVKDYLEILSNNREERYANVPPKVAE